MMPKRRYLKSLILILGCAVCGAHNCSAEWLRFTFHDQAGDPRDNFDVVAVQVSFNRDNGDFLVRATADAAHPFTGVHLLYLSVFNPDAGSAEPAASFFGVTRFPLATATPATTLQRLGNREVLKGWKLGDRVASYDAFGLPTGVQSLESVLGGTRQGFSDSDELRDTAVIEAVPEPATASMAAGALLSLMFCVRMRGRLASNSAA